MPIRVFIFSSFWNRQQSEPARQFQQRQPAEFPARQQTACAHRLAHPNVPTHRRVLPWDGRADQKPQRPPAKRFCRERLHGQAQSHAKPSRSYATARRQLELLPDNPVYSPQRSTNSVTVHALFSTPAACAGVMRIAPCVFTKL